MYRIYDDNRYHDIYFKLDNQQLMGAHRVVLITSDVEWFQTLLKSPFKDSKEQVVEVYDITSEVMHLILRYAYGIQPCYKDLDFETVFTIFQAANYFSCRSLVKYLKDYLSAHPDQTKIFWYVDCLIKFNTGFLETDPIPFPIDIFELHQYFEKKYLEPEIIDEAYKVCQLIEHRLMEYLSQEGTVESLSLVGAETLLKKIIYERLKYYYSGIFLSILMRFAKRGLIPYPEIIHFINYDEEHVIDVFPLKVGYSVYAPDYKPEKDYGTFVSGYNDSRDDVKLGEDIDDHTFYHFYKEY